MSGKLGFGVRLVFIVSSVERRKRSLVSLADLPELLHMIASRTEVNLGNLESRTKRNIHQDMSACILAQHAPKVCHFLLELLFTRQVWIGSRSCSTCTTRPSFVDGEFLRIALKLTCKFFHPFLEMFLGRFGPDEELPRLGELFSLRVTNEYDPTLSTCSW